MFVPTLPSAVLKTNFKHAISAFLILIKTETFTNDNNSQWNGKRSYDLSISKPFFRWIKWVNLPPVNLPPTCLNVSKIQSLFIFNRWKKQGPYADHQKMNVIFLKCVLATHLDVPKTDSKKMDSLAKMQKATASWGDVPSGMTSALNCLIMVRDNYNEWLITLTTIISLVLSCGNLRRRLVIMPLVAFFQDIA